LHAANATTATAQGETRLSFECDDIHGLAERLTAARVPDVTVYDEAYNRSLSCTDPLGDTIVVNGVSDDLYGYHERDVEPDPRWRVTAVRFTDPAGRYGDFLRLLDFVPVGDINEYYVNYAGPGASGQVGLHYRDEGDLPAEGPAVVRLNFESSEPLDTLAVRLEAAGYADTTITHEDFGSMLSVTDPDGQQLQVHRPPVDD
jgi:hypothetical protein